MLGLERAILQTYHHMDSHQQSYLSVTCGDMGPSWLYEDLSSNLPPPEIPEACAKELKSIIVFCLMILTDNIIHACECHCRLSYRYSSVHKLYQVTAYVLKFVSQLMDKNQPCQFNRMIWISCGSQIARYHYSEGQELSNIEVNILIST